MKQIEIGIAIQESRDATDSKDAKAAVQNFRECLESQFSGFSWKIELVSFTEEKGPEVLPLLEELFSLKSVYKWDLAFLLTEKGLHARHYAEAVVIPSSALELALISTRLLRSGQNDCEKITSMLLYSLGNLLGLEDDSEEAMRPPHHPESLELLPFSPEGNRRLEERLDDIGDARIEEKKECDRSAVAKGIFHLRAFFADARGILSDVIGYRPWKMPFQLGRLTTAAIVSMLFVFLGAEAWELGFAISWTVLATALSASLLIATAIVYNGQRLSGLLPSSPLTEQIARAKAVIVLCLFIGMLSLGIVLFAVSFGVSLVLPGDVIEAWIGKKLKLEDFSRFAAFTALLGILAGALGGNLEESEVFREELLVDEVI